jgi:hypothetical protein
MKQWACAGLLLAAILAAASGELAAQDKKLADTFTDPAEAGPDFKVQGEYLGENVDKAPLAAQVVALGDAKFDVYFLAGGLPGAGWDTKTRIKVPAQTQGDRTVIDGSGWTGEIRDGILTGKNKEGVGFTLRRIDRKSPTLGAKAPAGAVVLFDGSNEDHWAGGKLVENNLLYCGTRSKQGVCPAKLHIEFRTPFRPKGRGQGRGNSGVYIMGQEIQVLDSFGLTGEKGECGGLYGKARPAVNMCLPPLTWQTYDVEFKQGKEPGTLLLTVLHNGVKIHEDFAIKGSADKPATINLQNHGNPVVFRNIWFIPMDTAK